MDNNPETQGDINQPDTGSSSVQEVKISEPSKPSSGFLEDFKLFFLENSNLVIGGSIGTLVIVFGIIFAITSNQSAENQDSLQDIASMATGALLSENQESQFESPPTLEPKASTDTSTTSDASNTTDTSATTTTDSQTGATSGTILPPGTGGSIVATANTSNNTGSNATANPAVGSTLQTSATTSSPFGSNPFTSGSSPQGQNFSSLAANVPQATGSLGLNRNTGASAGFLSNTQSQVLQSRNVQGNTGPAVYYALGISFAAAAIIRRKRR